MTETKVNNNYEHDVVNIESSSLNIVSDTLLINDKNILFNLMDNAFSIMEKSTLKTINYDENIKYLNCHFYGLITKIILLDFPYSSYKLSFNGSNVISSSYNKEDNIQYFDFSKQNKSQTLEHFIMITKVSSEPELSNRNDYINLDNIDSIRLNVSKKIKLKEIHEILLDGYFIENKKWIKKIKSVKMYTSYVYVPKIYNRPLYSIQITNKMNDRTYRFIVIINGKEFGPFVISDTIFLKFKNPDKNFYGLQYEYLNETQKINSLNMVKIDKFIIVFLDKILNMNDIEFNQFYIETKNMSIENKFALNY